MAIKPILFNTEMVRAILDNRKTKTRRLLKIQPEYGEEIRIRKNKDGKLVGWFYCESPMLNPIDNSPWGGPEQEPPCQPGDVLWVHESWCNLPVSPGGHTRLMNGRYYYKADDPDIRPELWRGNWKPSIHMPKKAARIFLHVKSVTCERLHKITANECLKEGIKIESAYVDNSSTMGKIVSVYTEIETKFGRLWDSTISKDQLSTKGWAADPWVWVIEFERCEKPEGFGE